MGASHGAERAEHSKEGEGTRSDKESVRKQSEGSTDESPMTGASSGGSESTMTGASSGYSTTSFVAPLPIISRPFGGTGGIPTVASAASSMQFRPVPAPLSRMGSTDSACSSTSSNLYSKLEVFSSPDLGFMTTSSPTTPEAAAFTPSGTAVTFLRSPKQSDVKLHWPVTCMMNSSQKPVQDFDVDRAVKVRVNDMLMDSYLKSFAGRQDMRVQNRRDIAGDFQAADEAALITPDGTPQGRPRFRGFSSGFDTPDATPQRPMAGRPRFEGFGAGSYTLDATPVAGRPMSGGISNGWGTPVGTPIAGRPRSGGFGDEQLSGARQGVIDKADDFDRQYAAAQQYLKPKLTTLPPRRSRTISMGELSKWHQI